MPAQDIADLRRSYDKDELRVADAADDPLDQFEAWFAAAEEHDGIAEANAMTLATSTADGRPSARIVLLKGLDERGFVFYSNYRSRKGTELTQNPHAALVFWWEPMERQVRVEGPVRQLPDEESDEYFASRPRGSQLGAWASPQSQIIEDREVLHDNLEQAEERFDGDDVPRPPHWGGFRLQHEKIEFWQGRPSRLHDRLRYRRVEDENGEDWVLERLAP
jgi:pyridoxamine 5'-phosphate oxidase